MECENLGSRERLDLDIDFANKEYLEDEHFQDIEDLPAKLYKLKCEFMKSDSTCKGEIDYITFHVLVQGLGICQTLSELKKRVLEITGNTTGDITYKDCVMAVLGRRSTMCQKIMLFSGKGGGVVKKPCLMENKGSTFVSYLEFSIHPSPNSPFFPPPPPPSPADMDIGTASKTFSATYNLQSLGKPLKPEFP